jgi:peptide deformylase
MSEAKTTESARATGQPRRERAEISPERRAAAHRQIRTVGDPVLRETARAVTRFDDELAQLSRRMIRVMQDAPGVGLAATQLGVVRRVIVYQVNDEPVTLVNPEIVGSSGDTEVADEGCLSVPGVIVPVERPSEVRVRAQDLRGKRRDYEVADIEARVIQHEIDHLDGVLILERTSRADRARALRELRERDDAAVPADGTRL